MIENECYGVDNCPCTGCRMDLKDKRIAELEHQVARLKDFVNPAQDTLDPERPER